MSSITEALVNAGLTFKNVEAGKPLPPKVVGKTEAQQWASATVLVRPLKKRS